MKEKRFDKLLEVLRRSYKTRTQISAGPSFEQGVMREVRALAASSAASIEDDAAPMFLRFAFVALSLALVVQVWYPTNSSEDGLMVQSMAQLDPFYVSEVFDE